MVWLLREAGRFFDTSRSIDVNQSNFKYIETDEASLLALPPLRCLSIVSVEESNELTECIGKDSIDV